MKRLLLVALLLTTVNAFAQAPILRNSLTTNVLGTNLVWTPSTRTLTIENNSGAFEIVSNGVSMVLFSPLTGANQLPALNLVQFLTFNNSTNRMTATGNNLFWNGEQINGGSAAAPVNNWYSTNNFFVSGKGNTLVITQTLTVSGQYVYPLAAGTGITFTTNNIGTGQTNLTISASSSGDTTATNIVTLTMSGTNVSAMDYSLVQRGGAFKLVLTGTGYIGAPSGVANTPFSQAWLVVQQPSTGTCALTFTNGFYQFPEGVAPIIDTNNGAVTVFHFISDPITNGLLHGWMSVKSKLIP